MDGDGASGPFDALVFAGGGCRCFWQVGFLAVVSEEIGLRPREVAGVSAGAAMACVVFSDSVRTGIDYFLDRIAGNPRNVYPERVFRGGSIFPHEEIYRETILHVCDEEAVRRLHAGPRIRVLLTRIPRWIGSRTGVALGFLAYELEKLVAPGVHPEIARRLGFESDVVSLQSCSTGAEVAELILHSSCTPPFTPVYLRGGRPVLDGGLVDNVPVGALSTRARSTLVLLTRRCAPELLPRIPGRLYVQPSQDVPVDKWDYTSPERVRATLALGRRDGEAFMRARRQSKERQTPSTRRW